jgi:phage head maturation protease
MRKFIVTLAAITLLTAPAYAQSRGKGSKRSDSSQQTEDQKKKNAAAEKAYKDALHRIPEQKISDPWGNMR